MNGLRCKLLKGHKPETSMLSEIGRRVSCSDCDAFWLTWEGAYFDARRSFLKRIAKAPGYISPSVNAILQSRGIRTNRSVAPTGGGEA